MLSDAVKNLLEKYGSDLTVTRVASVSYDPSTGVATPAAATNPTLRGVFVNYMDSEIDGSLVQQGDRKLLVSLSGSTTTPQKGDQVGGMRIVSVRTFAPNGTAIAWTCQARA